MNSKKKMLLALTAAATLAVGACTFTACDLSSLIPGVGTTQGTVTVQLSETNAELVIGESLKLVATASDGGTIEWTTSDESVATVKNGRVNAVGAGEATITATCGEATATCTVKVVAVTLTLSQTSATIERGETLTLTATADREGDIVWTSSDETVAKVVDGVITAKKEGTATITATYGNTACKADCEVTVVWTNKPADYEEIAEGGESDAVATPNKFIAWNDHVDWCGTDVTVLQKEYMNESVYLEYSGVQKQTWFGMQLFYKKSTNQTDKKYCFSADIYSEAEGDVTINGTVVRLSVGENRVKVYYTETSGASLSMQMGVNGGDVIEANTLVIKNISFEEYSPVTLSAPTALEIAADGTVTVTDENEGHETNYSLCFYQNGALVYKTTVVDGGKLDNSFMEDGEYEVKVTAIGTGMYLDSAESGKLLTYTVSKGGISYDLSNGGSEAAVANPGKFYYWTEWEGIENAKYNNGKLSFDIVAGGSWYSNQFFMKDSSLKVGTRYTVTMKIESTVAGHIAVNGTNVELTEGVNLVSVRYTETAGDPSFSVQIGTINGTADISEGSFTISDLKYTEGMTFDESGLMAGVEADAIAFPGHFFYWTEWAGETGGSYKDGVLTFNFGNNGNWYSNQLFYRATDLQDGATYRMTFKLNSTAAGHIRINGQNIDIVEGDNNISVDYAQVGGATSLNMQMGIFWWDEGEHGDVNIQSGTIKISDLKYEKIGGGAETPVTPPTDHIDPDTIDRTNVPSVGLELADKYNEVYMFFWLKTETDMTKVSYVRVNGTRSAFLEMIQHEVDKTTYAFRSNVGDLTLDSYVFDFYDEDGNLIATGTYPTTTTPDPDTPNPDTPNPDTPVEAAKVELAFEMAYGEYYFQFNATSEAAINSAAKVHVNGTQQWSETIAGGNGYVFKVYVGDLTLDSYTFEWYNAEGKVFATATYTQTSGGGNETPDTPDPDTPVEAAKVELAFEMAYGEYYFQFNATSEAAINSAAKVHVNGTQQWAETIAGGNGYVFKVYVGDLTLDSYTFEWYNAEGKVFATATYTQTSGGGEETPDTPNPDTPNPDTPVEAAKVELAFEMAYGEYYFQFNATSEAAINSAAKVHVNGTQQWAETIAGGNGYVFKVYVGDLTLDSYTFEWYNAEGKVFATATYTQTSGGGEETPDTPNPDTPAGVTEVELTFVESYGNHYFHFTTNEASIKDAVYVKVNGTQRWSELSGEGTYAFKVYVGNLKLESYTFEWYNAEGKVFATATYTQTVEA